MSGIEHSYVVQYSIGEDKAGNEHWHDDSSYEFGFDPEDHEGMCAARGAATGVVLWLMDGEKHEEDFKMPYRVVHRIVSDEAL